MTGRRRHPRYQLTTPIEGELRVREEVVIERWSRKEVVVLSTMPSHGDDRLLLELAGEDLNALRVKVVDSKPVVAVDGSVRHRIRLALLVDGDSEDRGQTP